MRNIDNIYKFYNKLANVHAQNFPDMRIGQFFSNWLGWVMNVKQRDIFYPEEPEMERLLDEYVASHCPYNYGQNMFKDEK